MTTTQLLDSNKPTISSSKSNTNLSDLTDLTPTHANMPNSSSLRLTTSDMTDISAFLAASFIKNHGNAAATGTFKIFDQRRLSAHLLALQDNNRRLRLIVQRHTDSVNNNSTNNSHSPVLVSNQIPVPLCSSHNSNIATTRSATIQNQALKPDTSHMDYLKNVNIKEQLPSHATLCSQVTHNSNNTFNANINDAEKSMMTNTYEVNFSYNFSQLQDSFIPRALTPNFLQALSRPMNRIRIRHRKEINQRIKRASQQL
jgi:hypothetical protein